MVTRTREARGDGGVTLRDAGLGTRALQLLIDRLFPVDDADPAAPSTCGISPELIVRASCALRRPCMA